MLKINLLPIRQLKNRARARTQLVGFSLLFVFLLVILGAIGGYQYTIVTAANKLKVDLTKQKAALQPDLDKILQLEKAIAEVNRKVDVIKKLKQDSSLTVRVLDQVASKTDSSRLWLLNLNQQGGKLTLSGTALDSRTIAMFMNELKLSPYINSVTLTTSTLAKVSGKDLQTFSLICTVSTPPLDEQAPKTADKVANSN